MDPEKSPKLPVLEPQVNRQQLSIEQHHQELNMHPVGAEMLAFLRYYDDPLSKDPRTGIPDIDRYGDFILHIQSLRAARFGDDTGHFDPEADGDDHVKQPAAAESSRNRTAEPPTRRGKDNSTSIPGRVWPRQCVVLRTAPELLIPGSRRGDRINLERGELVRDVERISRDWWLGTNEKGERGLFPSRDVEPHW